MGLKIFKQYNYELINDSFTFTYPNNNTMTTFKSIEGILYLIYSKRNLSIISYDIIDNKKMNEIKNAHKELIINFRHHLDLNNKSDLIVSISIDGNMKLWKISNFECLFDINKACFLYSACFLTDNNQTYVITGNIFIKIYDLKGNIIKEIQEPNERSYIIDSYYDKKLSKYFILTGNEDQVKSIDYDNSKLYHKYCDNDEDEEESIPHNNLFIYDKDDLIKLIESSLDGYIRIWDFSSGVLINKIKAGVQLVRGCNLRNHQIEILCSISLWNNKYIIAACNNVIKFIEIKSGNIVRKINEDNVITLQKITHPKFGECLVSQGNMKSKIKLCIIKNDF